MSDTLNIYVADKYLNHSIKYNLTFTISSIPACVSHPRFTQNTSSNNSDAAFVSFTLIRLSHTSSFPRRFIPPCQTKI